MGHSRVVTGFRRFLIAGLAVLTLGLGPASMAAPVGPAPTETTPETTAPTPETTAPASETTAPAPAPETTTAAPETTAPAQSGPTDAADALTLSSESSDLFGTAEASTLAAGLPTGFTEETALSGLTLPTMVRFSADGRVFVVEKRGMVLAFDSLSDPTPKTVINLTGLTYGWADRGMHGMVLDPGFPSQPYMYLLYASDPLGWGDTCPNPPGGTIDGCVANARLTRIQVSATNDVVGGEQVLLSGFWCQQYPSHSIGQLEFGSDGALYVSAGDGASFTFADYGQGGGSSGSPTPENPCGDPPVPVGGDQQPPTAEGGALRSQDLRTAGDPVSFDGAILRIDKATGAAFTGNPLIGGDPGDDRIVAIGQRNPFRITIRPGTNEVWSADVGWNHWEEINRIPSPTGGLTNFGWPCYEGTEPNASYDGVNLNICENLYAASGAHTLPYFTYRHGLPVDGCDGQASSVSALVFYEGGNYPAEYDNALFFADYTRQCIWVMFPGGNGLPAVSNIQLFATAAPTVGMEIGPGGDLFAIDHSGGRVIRFRNSGGGTNTPPTAVAAAAPTSGVAPLVVNFDGSGSSDPDGDTLTFAWDLDGDGQFDDSNAINPSFTYSTANTYVATLRVDDSNGGIDTDTVTITVTTSGGGGGDGSVDLPGVAGNYISAPDNARLDLTGDADFRADVSLDDWQTNNGKLISKMGGAYEFLLDKATGGLRVAWRDSAGLLKIRNSTVALPIADGQRLQVRGTLDVDNGSGGHTVTFYYRTDTTLSLTNHTGWTQLGNPVTFTGTTNIRTDNNTVALGSSPGGSTNFWAGNYYQAAIFNGIAGTNVANPDFRTTTQLTSTPPDYSQWRDTPTNPWTINGTNWTYITGGGGGTNTPPTAVAAAAPTSGVAPLVVNFNGSGSSDPDGDTLTFAWDLDGDGQFDDSNAINPSFTYSTANTYVATLRVDDSNGGIDTDTVTITVTTSGGGGGDGSVDLPGVAGNYISAPDNARLDLTGDADFRADVSLDDWQTNNGKLISKMGGAYEFLLDKATGGLRVAWRDSAGLLKIRNSTVALPIADGQRLQVRGTLDVDNGSGGHTVTFYYRTDTTLSLTNHTGWTQLGNPVTFTGTTNIRTDNNTVALGSSPGGSTNFWAGNYYQAAIFNGIAGTNVANPDFRTTTQLTSTPPDYSQWRDTPTNPWTINGTNWTYTPG